MIERIFNIVKEDYYKYMNNFPHNYINERIQYYGAVYEPLPIKKHYIIVGAEGHGILNDSSDSGDITSR